MARRADSKPTDRPKSLRRSAARPRKTLDSRGRPNQLSMSTPDMNAINLNAVLQIGAVTLGFLATVATVLMSRSVKGLKARSLALETGLAATRRELEMMAAI